MPARSAGPRVPVLPSDGGRFSWFATSRRMHWSDSVSRLHGYAPGTVTPTLALALQSKHPDDFYACVDALHAGMVSGQLVVHEHRLRDVAGEVRRVVEVVRATLDGSGAVQSLYGFLLPTSPALAGAATPPPASGLISLISAVFQVSPAAAGVLAGCRQPMTVRRLTRPAASRGDLCAGTVVGTRELLADSLFPLEHLQPGPTALAA